MNTIHRRQFLQTTVMAVGGAALGELVALGNEPSYPLADKTEWLAPYGGFKMGAESYSLRNFDLDGCLSRMQKMGLHYVEFFFGHLTPPSNEEKLNALRATLVKYEVKLLGFFVSGFGNTVDSNRPAFRFAKAMGIKVLVGDPPPESFESLDKLVEEYGVAVAIHNHGPGSRYDKIADVEKAIEGRHKLIGACVDTGHFLHSDEDPVKAIETFGERTYEVHLKEVDKQQRFQVLGKGRLDTVGVLRALKKIRFDGCLALEYEENPANPVADMDECLRVVREAAKQL
jgi:inosose dehydratase